MYRVEESAYVIVTFWPLQWFGGIVPPCPLFSPLVMCKKIWKCTEKKQIFKSEPNGLLFHEHLQFSNTIRHGVAHTANKRYCILGFLV